MINQPSVESLINKLETDNLAVSRYALCVVAAKRARQLAENGTVSSPKENPNNEKELTLACGEIAEGKVIIAKD